MAELPSAYAPGIISDEPAPPRPPQRATTFLIAAFVATLVASGTMLQVGAGSLEAPGEQRKLSFLFGIAAIPIALLPLWACLTDALALWGSRREGYLVLTSLMATTAWVAIAFANTHYAVWIAAAAVLGLASSVSRAAITGALAEIGQRRGVTGPLAAAYIGLSRLGAAAVIPLTVMNTLAPISLLAGLAAGLSLTVPLLILAFAVGDASSAVAVAAPVAARITIPRFLRSRPFWAALAVVVSAGLATVPNELRIGGGADGASAPWTAQAALEGSLIGAPIIYLLLSRRVGFAALLRISLVVKALALVAAALPASGATGVAFFARAGANSLLSCALMDLALRVAPRGREAFGAILLAGITQVMIIVSNAIESPVFYDHDWLLLVGCLAAGAAVAGALAVALLPSTICETPARPVIGSLP